MKKYLFYFVLLSTIIIAYYDGFHPTSYLRSQDYVEGDRLVPRVLMGLNILVFIYFIVKSFRIKLLNSKRFKKTLLLFFMFLLISNLFNFDFLWLSKVTFTLLIFYPFYYASIKGYFSNRAFYIVGFSLLFIYIIAFYQGVIIRSYMIRESFEYADNLGYTFIALMAYFSMLPNKPITKYLMTVLLVLVLLSFKRGAIICACLGYISFIIYNFKYTKLNHRHVLLVALLSAGAVFFSLQFKDVIMYRFLYDTYGYSGRIDPYQIILDNTLDAHFLFILFGHGFFSVTNILGGLYAHSDWLELIYDHGLIGIMMYIFLLFSFILENKTIPKHLKASFVLILVVWILKSIFSGVYMDRSFSLFIAAIGILLGEAHKTFQDSTCPSGVK